MSAFDPILPPWDVSIKRTEVTEYRLPQCRAAEDLVKMINKAMQDRQVDVHRGRQPRDVLVRPDGEYIVAYYERTVPLSASQASSCCNGCDQCEEEDDE